MLEKNSLHTVEITGYSSEGMGVARIDGMAVFVKEAILGEICEIKLLRVEKTVAYAKVERLLKASPERIAPDCPAFGRCGGCALRHMSYEEELELKLRRVNDALQRIGGLEIQAEEILPNPQPEYYRNKGQYAVGSRDGRAVTGFYRPRSHELIPVEHCRIQDPASDAVAAAVRRWMDEFSVPPYDEKDGDGLVRYVYARTGSVSGETLAVVSMAKRAIPARDRLVEYIKGCGARVVGVVQNINASRGNALLAGEFVTLDGRDYIEDELCGLRFRLSARSFYQVNHAQAERLYAKALEYAALDGTQTVIDLYCGTGTITLCLAAAAREVIGAEIVESAVRDAGENAARNGVKNVRFICADAGQTAQQLEREGLRPDVVVVDPPRKGLSEDVIEAVGRMAPQRVVYVSCDPATMARDLKRFAGVGYAARRVTAVDMFSRTSSVECVCLLMEAKDE